MEHDFWHRRWAKNEIGFHEPAANPLLVKHFSALNLPPASTIFLPLCGKTLDIGWLLAAGYHVIGAELSELAVQQLFNELGVAPQVSQTGILKRYDATNLRVYVGDLFKLTAEQLGTVDAVYDRAALVALPETLRTQYASHLATITNRAAQLLISFDYDQTLLNGPPFSVDAEQIRALYGAHYQLQIIEQKALAGGLKGQCPADEVVWLLSPK